MHHFILPTQDTWISSGSSKVTGESFLEANFGKDEVLQIDKVFQNNLPLPLRPFPFLLER